ncbi:hypothetical protein [Pseudomonas costantinii]|uniref:Lipoprotein n=1 Tax=Pseudomonas costantinii TaxID=168469 RepID=A0A1S2V5J9_9PSED|nr:hypothetical protein [Pseudomonas costantinii]OIN54001.1 hypothetical protein BFL40_07370 [Pseudomonas costantinii]SED17212.1 hypothetical protein SAMN04515675_0124 [Pseudomonas costantinii]
MNKIFFTCLFLTLAACGDAHQVPSSKNAETAAVSASTVPNDPVAVLANARQATSSAGANEDQLDVAIKQIQALIADGGAERVEAVGHHEAELISTLGALYVRKAVFHVDNARQAGALVATGFRYLDRAVAQFPDNLTARINRGLTCANVPEFMGKAELAREDLRIAAASPGFVRLPAGLQDKVRSTQAMLDQQPAAAHTQN